MPANKDKKTGKWNCTFYYTDWTGKKIKKMKRGFATKGEALDWERHFLLEKASSLDMTFLKLNSSHLQYVLGCMSNNTTKVSNIRAYLITALYNAPNTISNYYNAEVQHDLYGSWRDE